MQPRALKTLNNYCSTDFHPPLKLLNCTKGNRVCVFYNVLNSLLTFLCCGGSAMLACGGHNTTCVNWFLLVGSGEQTELLGLGDKIDAFTY